MAQRKLRTFQMRTDDGFMEAVDDWRARQRPILSRAEAIQRLVAMALKSDKPKPQK
jgi:hypothetical protein